MPYSKNSRDKLRPRRRPYIQSVPMWRMQQVPRVDRAPFPRAYGPPIPAAVPANQPELKHYTKVGAATDLDTTGGQVLINAMVQGNTHSTRVARRITIRTIFVRGLTRYDPATIVNTNVGVVTLVQIKNAGAVAHSAINIFTGAIGPLSDQGCLIARPMRRHTHVGGPPAMNLPLAASFEWFIKCNILVLFTGTDIDSDPTSIQQNQIWLMFLGSLAPGVDSGIVTYYTKIGYTDD